MKKLVLTALAFSCSITYAQEQVLVISGGDNPGLNHYSQYLQTKLLYNSLLAKYGNDAVNIYFGAGNNPTTTSSLLDVHQLKNTKEDKFNKTDTMFAGVLPNNQAATKANVSAYFMSPLISKILPTENFRLFVSDHGMPNSFSEDKEENPFGDNCIDLWHYNQKVINNFTDAKNFYQACLSKNELSSLLTQIPAQRIIFQMSQCFSGGFHQISVAEKDGYPTANPKICGFTAVSDDHGASGCTADADGASYQGYERSFTEWYTGIDVINGKKLREPASSMFIAHRNAALEDMTQDVPLSTSNYYLLQWADFFSQDKFTSRIDNYDNKAINKIYQDYRHYLTSIKDPELQEFIQFTKALEQKIDPIVPAAPAFSALSLAKQAEQIKQLEHQIQQQGVELTSSWEGMMNAYLNLIMPAWNKAVEAHQVTKLSDKDYLFEHEFYQPIVSNRLFEHPYQFDMYFLQYLSMKNNDSDLVNYQKHRIELIKQWALENKNQALANACDYWQKLNKTQQQFKDQIDKSETSKQLLNRLFTYNKIIAAWVTLNKIQDETALHELSDLLACEHAG